MTEPDGSVLLITSSRARINLCRGFAAISHHDLNPYSLYPKYIVRPKHESQTCSPGFHFFRRGVTLLFPEGRNETIWIKTCTRSSYGGRLVCTQNPFQYFHCVLYLGRHRVKQVCHECDSKKKKKKRAGVTKRKFLPERIRISFVFKRWPDNLQYVFLFFY